LNTWWAPIIARSLSHFLHFPRPEEVLARKTALQVFSAKKVVLTERQELQDWHRSALGWCRAQLGTVTRNAAREALVSWYHGPRWIWNQAVRETRGERKKNPKIYCWIDWKSRGKKASFSLLPAQVASRLGPKEVRGSFFSI